VKDLPELKVRIAIDAVDAFETLTKLKTKLEEILLLEKEITELRVHAVTMNVADGLSVETIANQIVERLSETPIAY